MSRPEPTTLVHCPDCGTTRLISVSWQRRCAKENRPPPCPMCGKIDHNSHTENGLWWWLEQYGVERNGITASEHVQRHGVPPALAEILDGIRQALV